MADYGKKDENIFKLTKSGRHRVTHGSMDNHRREALSLFFDCNGDTAGQLRNGEIKTNIINDAILSPI